MSNAATVRKVRASNQLLGTWSWPDVHDSLILLVPVGSTEQHGPHLPLDTDTRIAVAVAEGAAADFAGCVVAPAVAYGASGEHDGFAGTLSIGSEVLSSVLVELARSADHFNRVVFVNGHGGNLSALQTAQAVLVAEGRQSDLWVPTVPGGDAHAGETETSLMLAIASDLVGDTSGVSGDTRPLQEILPELRRDGVISVSASGVLGDPRGASAERGNEILASLVASLVAQLTDSEQNA